MNRKFEITTDLSKFYFELEICKNKKEMHEIIKKETYQKEVEEDVSGMFSPFCSYHWDEDGELIRSNNCVGKMYLVETYLTKEVVAHEIVHATFSVYRTEINPSVYKEVDANFGNGDDMDKEERFAYLYGRFSKKVWLIVEDF